MTIASWAAYQQARPDAASLPKAGSGNGAGGNRVTWLREMERSQIEAWLGRSVALPEQSADEWKNLQATASEEGPRTKTLISNLSPGGSISPASKPAAASAHAAQPTSGGVMAAFMQARASAAQAPVPFASVPYRPSYQVADTAGKQANVAREEVPSRPALLDAGAQAPVRVTVERTGNGIRVWLGIDREAVPQTVLQQLVGKLRSALGKAGLPLQAVVCNGNAYRLAPAAEEDFPAASGVDMSQALSLVEEKTRLDIVEMRRRHGH